MKTRKITGYRLISDPCAAIALPVYFTLRPHYEGCYRTDVPGREDLFAQIKREGRLWLVEIRSKESGDLKRCAGKWQTLKDACDEIILVGV